jgi:hypothetical protein
MPLCPVLAGDIVSDFVKERAADARKNFHPSMMLSELGSIWEGVDCHSLWEGDRTGLR